MLHEQHESRYQHLRVVLFIDEFDKLYRAPQDVIDSVLDLFRGLKHQRDAYLLQVRDVYIF